MIRASFARGIVGPALLAAVAFAMTAWLPPLRTIGPLTLALLLGLAAGVIWRNGSLDGGLPAGDAPGIAFAARTLLRLGVVLVGVRLDFAVIAKVGWRIFALDVAVVAFGLVFMILLGRKLGLPAPLATLLAVGTSVCGASAVAAAKDCARADDDDVAMGVALCGVIGTSAVLVYLALRSILSLPALVYGTFAGATIHEVAQVLAAVTPVPEAVALATATKLARVVLLPIVVVVLELVLHGRDHVGKGSGKRAPILPGFVIGFVVVAIANSLAPSLVPAELLKTIRADVILASTLLMTIAMAAAGVQIHWSAVRRTGGRAVATMAIGSLAFSLVGFALVRLLGLGL